MDVTCCEDGGDGDNFLLGAVVALLLVVAVDLVLDGPAAIVATGFVGRTARERFGAGSASSSAADAPASSSLRPGASFRFFGETLSDDGSAEVLTSCFSREAVALSVLIGRTGFPSECFVCFTTVSGLACDDFRNPDRSIGATAIADANALGRFADGDRLRVVGPGAEDGLWLVDGGSLGTAVVDSGGRLAAAADVLGCLVEDERLTVVGSGGKVFFGLVELSSIGAAASVATG